eukprot:1362151-Amphidinium_carterae.2
MCTKRSKQLTSGAQSCFVESAGRANWTPSLRWFHRRRNSTQLGLTCWRSPRQTNPLETGMVHRSLWVLHIYLLHVVVRWGVGPVGAWSMEDRLVFKSASGHAPGFSEDVLSVHVSSATRKILKHFKSHTAWHGTRSNSPALTLCSL